MPTASKRRSGQPRQAVRRAAVDETSVEIVDERPSLTDFRPLMQNPNKHTPRGLQLLEDALHSDGYVAPMTATADGTIIDGNARLETVAHALPNEPIVIKHDGTRPIIAVRTDIPNADDVRAKRIAVAANRIAAIDLDWDVSILRTLQGDGVDLSALWTEKELTGLKASDRPAAINVETLDQWAIVVSLTNEEQQRTLLDELTARGFACRSLIL